MQRTARLIGKVAGKPVYRIPVTVRLNNSRTFDSVEMTVEVISHSAADAANWVRDQWAERAETEVIAYGPKGGETRRFIGWESSVFAAMLNAPRPSLALDLDYHS